MGVKRHEVVQSILDLFERPSYLEVGVSKGLTFHNITAARKVAVDPVFKFDFVEAQKNDHAEYHQILSDEYFGRVAGNDDRFDVIYLDGMHTLEQTLRDFTNALHFLAKRGIIIIDDVKPYSYVSSLRDIEIFRQMKAALKIEQKGWMGDVYRLVYFIETFHQQLRYRTVSNNHGQLIVWSARRPSTPDRMIGEIASMPFESLILNKEPLNLKSLDEIVEELRAWKSDGK